jgi:hypothetical protein
LTVAALGLLTATFTVAIFVVSPRRYAFGQKLRQFVPGIADDRPRSVRGITAHMVASFESQRAMNQPKIDKMYTGVTAMCVLLGLQIACWIAAAL